MGPLALAAALPGLQCTQCGGDDPRKKGRLAGAGGALFLLAGEEEPPGTPGGNPPIGTPNGNPPLGPPMGTPL